MANATTLALLLRQFIEAVESLWQSYLATGPGRLKAEHFEPVHASYVALRDAAGKAHAEVLPDSLGNPREWVNEVSAQAKRLHQLCQLCACTPQGLSFITGEAGLIPRKDQHRAVDDALHNLTDAASRLESGLS